MKSEGKFLLTEYFTMYPVNAGLITPAEFANVFERPIKTLACCGAISK